MKAIEKKIIKKYFNYALRYIFVPFLLEIIIESFNRKSIIDGVGYLFSFPTLFIFNALIITLTLSVALFFKREMFVYLSVCIVWLIFGIINFVVLSFRVTPFSAVDITLLESAISVSGHYLNFMNIAMIVIGVVLVIVSIVCLFRMTPKHTHLTQKRLVVSFVCVCLVVLSIVFLQNSSKSVKSLNQNYTNISEAYENYGFVYCFANSIVDTGISMPDDYSKESVDEIVGDISDVGESKSIKPNIIFVQWESFFDPNTIKGLELSEDCIPNFRKLQSNYSNGLITVPTVGAGTVNTEFEVLTGLSQKDFGTSEYPYKTILRDTTAESICYDVKNIGYKAHCVHNNEGTFYGRNKVFANLGFDTFTSMEYMNGLEDNPNGWKKDAILSDEVIKSLDSTTEPDFTMAITVQTHGKYAGFESDNQKIKVKKAPSGMKESYEYYVNQLYESDQMLGNLIDKLNKRKEKTILLIYGDHLPSLNIKKKDLKQSNLYQTQYVIWDNMGLEKENENYTSYQIGAKILEKVGIHEGNITKFHQKYEHKTKTYHEKLKTLAYDMLYGECYAYNGEKPYKPSSLRMGTDEIRITNIERKSSGFVVTGVHFTPYCKLIFNGDELSVKWLDANHLLIEDEFELDNETLNEPAPTPDENGEIDRNDIPNSFYIQVQTEGGTVLSESNVVRWENTSLSAK